MFDIRDALLKEGLDYDLNQLRTLIAEHYQLAEPIVLERMLSILPDDESLQRRQSRRAEQLIEQIRTEYKGDSIDAFLQQYSLETQEGIILMCLAEALLRIPDAETADKLIRDKLAGADWNSHLKSSESVLVNASTWGLVLTGKIIGVDPELSGEANSLLARMVNRLGEPVVRRAMYTAMRLMGRQFVLGTNIKNALKSSKKALEKGYWHSFDMLGEAALTTTDAKRYLNDYRQAIVEIDQYRGDSDVINASISIKLSALHPRYEFSHRQRVLDELANDVIDLVELGREHNVSITIDAEEVDRLELSLDLFEKVYRSDAARGWGQFGLVVQSYAKWALPVLMWINRLAQEQGDRIPVRLVKGAYWDAEIKHSQQLGLNDYPLFTRKAGTDVSYLGCAKYLLSEATQGNIYPQFATHNAHTMVAIHEMAEEREFEFQRLHGMGEGLYDIVMVQHPDIRVRIYAPVGEHRDLLPYLVRRLLENGANTSFVHKLLDAKVPPAILAEHPIITLHSKPTLHNHQLPKPTEILAPRVNSSGVNLNISCEYQPFISELETWQEHQWLGGPLIAGKLMKTEQEYSIYSPQHRKQQVGTLYYADENLVAEAFAVADSGFHKWQRTPAEQRATILENLADLLQQHQGELIALCIAEAGKTLQDGIDEIREAIDFCRYYAEQCRLRFSHGIELPGPTGESNVLYLEGRGVFVCISPWNFPVAIFCGQICAALAAGNAVLAKPAEQTSLIATRVVQLMHQAGVPNTIIQLLPGTGEQVGNALVSHYLTAGVAFTGSTQTAKHINHELAERSGPIVPLIAETGGQNAMLVDSTALPEQVVKDAIHSAFASAGQRCSALRVMFVQEDIAERIIELIQGAMSELTVGDPAHYQTDVGPVIDSRARTALQRHLEEVTQFGTLLAQTPLSNYCDGGYFVPPTAVEIDSIDRLDEEHFGPILHVVRYRANALNQVIDAINNTGYGLTLGIHSRNERRAEWIASQIRVGNVYINRNQIGAVVGVQPFGGQGLSGTGPKAGGPHYLLRFATERTVTNNLTAIGGNTTLLTLGDE